MNLESRLKKMAFNYLFGNYAQSIIFNTANGLLSSDPGDIEINRKLGNNGQYDIENIYCLSSLIDKEFVIYILGAHIGTLLVPLSKKVKMIYGFEANPDTFHYLNDNLALNKIDNACIFNCGIYNEQGNIPFYKNKANTGGSKIKPVKDDFIYNYDDPELKMIETVCMDNFQIQHNLLMPDMMIVDIEGSEYAALSKSSNSLFHCKYLYIEFVPHHLSNVANINVEAFLSVIIPYFNEMRIMGFERLFTGDDIYKVLETCASNNLSVNLLFSKL